MNSNPLSVRVAGLELRNPTVLASGILGYTAESLQRVVEGGAGAVVTKSVGVAPRMGYANPTVVQATGGLINAKTKSVTKTFFTFLSFGWCRHRLS